MLNLNKKIIEKKLDIKLKEGTSLGVDTASRTGWALINVGKKDVNIDYGFIEIHTKDLYIKYNQMIKIFKGIISDNKIGSIVIEDTFFGTNVHVLKLLSRIGMIVYVLSYLKPIDNIKFLSPVTARKNVSLKGNKKKSIVQEEFINKIDIDIKDIDIIDAIILGINGVIEHESLL